MNTPAAHKDVYNLDRDNAFLHISEKQGKNKASTHHHHAKQNRQRLNASNHLLKLNMFAETTRPPLPPDNWPSRPPFREDWTADVPCSQDFGIEKRKQ
ncbi:hypothetical protein N7534_010214 [Penicillium rubens]|nr:hypothetical protein N7534_010214 [Penicillium rubens]